MKAESDLTPAERHLLMLYTFYESELLGSGWITENDRWNELLYAMLSATSTPAEVARLAMSALRPLGLTDLDVLASMKVAVEKYILGNDYSINLSDDATAVIQIMQRSGVSAEDALSTLGVWHNLAKASRDVWGGSLRLLLNHHARALIQDLVSAGSTKYVDEGRIVRGVSLFLQNAMNFPISISSDSINRFCARYGISEDDLAAIGERLDLSVSLIDDLVGMGEEDEEFKRWFAENERSRTASADTPEPQADYLDSGQSTSLQ